MATVTRRRRSSYNLFPSWITLKRALLISSVTVVALGGLFGTRVVLSLAKFTHQNPLQVLGQIISGGGDSSVSASAHELNRINIALYGYGGPGHDGAYLTDSIMVISIQPRSGRPPQVAEISIPRDWYVPYAFPDGKHGGGRINAAYAAGMDGEGSVPAGAPNAGASIANPTLEHLLGIHIDHWVGVDFHAFEAAVNAVGGVGINVPASFTDYDYPAGECQGGSGNCAYMTVHFNAGWQHMDGARALIFSRSRHSSDNGEGTDFARSRRQQLVVAALKQKVVSLGGIGNLPDLLNALGDNVVTDLHVNDIIALYQLVKDVNTKSITHISLDDQNFLYECGYPTNCGAAYLYAHDRSYQEVMQYISNALPDPSVLTGPITVEDGSGYRTQASARWSKLFSMLGFATTDGGTVRRHYITEVIDSSGGKYSATAQWLARYFGVSATTAAPASPSSSPGVATTAPKPGITLILGRDEELAFNRDPGVGK